MFLELLCHNYEALIYHCKLLCHNYEPLILLCPFFNQSGKCQDVLISKGHNMNSNYFGVSGTELYINGQQKTEFQLHTILILGQTDH